MNNLLRPVLALALCFTADATMAADMINFWDTPQRGGNSFNGTAPDQAYFDALAATGATWVRLAPSKWQGSGQDFLLGDADGYSGLPADDLAMLIAALDRAHAAGLKVVITPLSLPGARWAQQNCGSFDTRLWTDRTFWDQSVRFWVDLATALRDHPAIAAYNLVNEPAPERGTGLDEYANRDAKQAWYSENAGTARDLPALYAQIIAAIREVDAATPIMVDAGFYANARNFDYWPSALPDDKVLYAFHMYEPYQATSSPNMKRDDPYRYPGVTLPYGTAEISWNRDAVADHIAAPFEWAATQGIPSSRVVAAEFGCMRRWSDCGTYLSGVVDILEDHQAHWAFYSFREDVWDGMDYELPPSVTPGQFYWLTEQGKPENLKRGGPLFDILARKMKP